MIEANNCIDLWHCIINILFMSMSIDHQSYTTTNLLLPLFAGESFQTEYIYLENCQLTGSTEYISVQCSYPSNSVATGFQVVAQMSNLTEVHKLYTGKTSENSVTVQVGENGEYQVSVFAIRGRMGILNSNIEYRGQISVMELTGTHT